MGCYFFAEKSNAKSRPKSNTALPIAIGIGEQLYSTVVLL